MSGEPLLPYHTAESGPGVGLFTTTMGKLQRQLQTGEYNIFKDAPIFESDFIQITKRGEVIDVHNRVRMVTVGIASTSPILPLPDVMLLARPATRCKEHAGRSQATKGKGRKAAKTLELTRLLPLKFVRISIQDREKQQLRLKFATGRSCYLQLCPPRDMREDLFVYWEKLIYLLRPPVDSQSSTYAIPARDMLCMPVFKEEDRRSPAAADFQGKGDQDQVSIRSLHVGSEVAEATSAAFAGGEGIQLDSYTPDTGPDAATANAQPTELAAGSAVGATTELEAAEGAAGAKAGALSVAVTESTAPEEQSTAIAATAVQGPGGSQTNAATADAAKTSLRSRKRAPAGGAHTVEYASSVSTSPSPEASSTAVRAEPTSRTGKGTADKEDEGNLISTLPQEGQVSEQDGAPRRVPQDRKRRRERRERREKERALRSSQLRRAAESHPKPGGDKTIRKATGRSSGSRGATRDDKKEKGHGSPGNSKRGTTHKGISHAPITKESTTSHKSGRSLSTGSSGSSPKRLSRISSFLRNVRTSLTTKTVATYRDKDVAILAKAAERAGMEAIIETAGSGQGLETTVHVTSETMEAVTVEAHQ
ncbi:Golgi-associated RAB2 interactor protein 4 [Hippopotamus amphibius kiboko]|uniref:Golgi-associated RAB2 interactor protein 4 n=1 Tax=Hippopotamus amphibius kiboko TaxID=575201 RepID=UPI002594AFDA|nr:Golgi-associated RAB2 interactor protein 4 [Hippopotamus amphibius kiboko]